MLILPWLGALTCWIIVPDLFSFRAMIIHPSLSSVKKWRSRIPNFVSWNWSANSKPCWIEVTISLNHTKNWSVNSTTGSWTVGYLLTDFLPRVCTGAIRRLWKLRSEEKQRIIIRRACTKIFGLYNETRIPETVGPRPSILRSLQEMAGWGGSQPSGGWVSSSIIHCSKSVCSKEYSQFREVLWQHSLTGYIMSGIHFTRHTLKPTSAFQKKDYVSMYGIYCEHLGPSR
jgi:hypothetical protein